MSRPIVLSNNNLFVGLDRYGLVNDFYFPYVGQDNLTTARSLHHKIGVFVDNEFSWVNDGNWIIDLNYVPDSLVSKITMENTKLQIKLEMNDYIDCDFNTFIRHINIHNLSTEQREIRIFMHQVFRISAEGRGDTVLYVPDKNYIYDYRGKVSLIINGKFEDGKSFDQYSVGNYHIEGKLGTYKDAEDGELSNNPVEHSSVDSTIRFKKVFLPNSSVALDYWVIAIENLYEGRKLNDYYMKTSMSDRLKYVTNHWIKWVEPTKETDLDYKKEINRSLLIIKAHCNDNGTIIASGDSSIFNYGRDYYAYCWTRDASFSLWPLLRLKYFDEAKSFFKFCSEVITPEGYLMHKYQPDKSVGSTWHSQLLNGRNRLTIQEDETAIVIYLLEQYYNESNDIDLITYYFKKLIEPAANFMASYIDINTGLPHASYDLWEEKYLTTTYTSSLVMASLDSACNLAKLVNDTQYVDFWQNASNTIKQSLNKLYDKTLGYYIKGFVFNPELNEFEYDKTLDMSSLYGIYLFGKINLNDEYFQNTLKVVEEKLKYNNEDHGVIRYYNDNYFRVDEKSPGNPWIMTSLWLAQIYISLKKTQDAKPIIDWVINYASSGGTLSEQRNPHTNSPISVDPLVWSHAELINTIIDLRGV